MRDVKTALLDELTSYYHGDELPPPAAFAKSIPERARASAARLHKVVGAAEVPSLVALLRALGRDAGHPLHADIAGSTGIHWPDDPDSWVAFQELADRIAADLVP